MFSRFSTVFVCAAVVFAAIAPGRSVAQQSCDSFDECTINGVCQVDGTCKGTARPNGDSCDDGNPCTTNDRCQAGSCRGSATSGNSCASVYSVLGPCLLSATCMVGTCIPSFKTCPATDSNNCTFDVCNPANGQCTVFTNTCQDACSTAQCDPGTGECINKQPANSGGSCDDGNECTSNDRCSNGECVGMGGSSGPTATRTPTRTPTTGTTPGPICDGDCGDCNGDGCVSLMEVVHGIRAALEQESASECSLDLDHNGSIDIDEIIAALSAVGRPCRVTPTHTAVVPAATPTRTAIAPTATATRTATSVVITVTPGGPTVTPTRTPTTGTTTATTISRAAGMIQGASSALLIVPDLLSAVLGHLPQTSLKRIHVSIPFSFSCPDGGGGTITCDQDIAVLPTNISAPIYSVQLNSCEASVSSGAMVTLTGALTYTGNEGEVCGSIPDSGTLAIQNLTIEEAGSAGTLTASFANFSAHVTLGGSDNDCTYNTVTLDLSGSMTVTAKNAQGQQITSTQATFGNGASIAIGITQYGPNCQPAIYSSSLNGMATLVTGGASFQATFDPLTVANDTTAGNSSVTVIGDVTSACLGGGSTQLATRSNLEIEAGAACPHAGEEIVAHGVDFAVHDLIRYKASGLDLDYGDDGTVDATFDSCLDPRLSVCAGS